MKTNVRFDSWRARSGSHEIHVTEAGSGPPIAFIAGLGYASFCWEEVMTALASSFRLIAFDNRGSGRSDKPAGPYSIELLADDAAAVIASAGVDSAHVIGNSMGGYIALTLAARHPTRVRSIVLSNTSHGGEGCVPTPEETRRAWGEASSLSPREYASRTMAYSYPPGWADSNPERFAAILERRLAFPTPQDAWRAQYAACETFLARGLDVATIAQPALVVHGTVDRVVPYENGPRLARALPRGKLVTLEGRGHLPFLEAPEEFLSVVQPFLSSIEASR